MARFVIVLHKQIQRNKAILEEFIDTACSNTIVDAVYELCNSPQVVFNCRDTLTSSQAWAQHQKVCPGSQKFERRTR